jgi:Flp pilus assembly protein TadG
VLNRPNSIYGSIKNCSFFKPSRAIFTTRRFAADSTGTTAIEFGFVALPFFMMVFGVINIGMYFYTVNSIDRGLEDASRRIRTGELQNCAASVGDFKSLMCSSASGYIECNKLNVLIQSAPDWGDLTAQSCQSAGGLTPSSGVSSQDLADLAGNQNAVVLVTACYEWELAQYLPFLKLGNLSNGSMLIQSTSAFRTEPFVAGGATCP